MSDEKSKKPKIDLKARLGKTMGPGSSPSAVPLPIPGPAVGSAPPPSGDGLQVATPSRPSGIAPPPGISPGIPVPPFATAQRTAPPPEPKPTAVAQTIKVEIGEEVQEERRKASKRAALYATITALVGLAIGFGIGGAQERSERGKAAVRGAAALEKDVKAANDAMKDLAGKLEAAAEKLGEKEYPTELAKELGGINVPFDATNLEGKSVGSLPGNVLRALLRYTQAVGELNKTKDTLKNLLSAAQPQVEKAWKEEKDPVVNFSVLFRAEGQKGIVAELVPNKEPFAIGKDWPASYTVMKLERTQQGPKTVEKKATRWTKGDLTGSDPLAIPVDPATVAAFTTQELVFKLSKALRDTRVLVDGDKDNPQGSAGLLKEGDDLANELHKIALRN